MTKELSKQLCELCGIKRKKKIFSQNCDNTCKYYDKNDIYDPCKRGDNPCPTRIEYIYPDFGKPNNFVKLISLSLNAYPTCCLIDYILNIRCFYNEYIFLENVIEVLNSQRDISNELKQAIKNTEWEY